MVNPDENKNRDLEFLSILPTAWPIYQGGVGKIGKIGQFRVILKIKLPSLKESSFCFKFFYLLHKINQPLHSPFLCLIFRGKAAWSRMINFIKLRQKFGNFPNYGGVTDLRDLRENSTNIQMRDRTLRSFQGYEKMHP